MIAARARRPQQLLPLQFSVPLPPVLVPPPSANAGAVAALTPNRRMIAASRMRMAISLSGIFLQREVVSPTVKLAKTARRRPEGLQ